MKYLLCSVVVSITISFLILGHTSVLNLCDLETCPFCYGETICSEIRNNKITLKYETLTELFYNILSVKNVYFGRYGTKDVVLKKLAHNDELLKINDVISDCDIETFVVNKYENRQFRICDRYSAQKLLKSLHYEDIRHLYTIFQVNIEPVLLQIFPKEDNWPVPTLYGFCGRLAVEEYCGDSLSLVEHYDWFDRAYVAYQILWQAKNFTEDHNTFRLYLTDISPDNIVVDSRLKVSFVDLENVVLKAKVLNVSEAEHVSKNFEDDFYGFSEADICNSKRSDHNIYSVCKLLLSKYSPWPMMKNGLLHTPPKILEHRSLFQNIELCVHSDQKLNRFILSDVILKDFEEILIFHTNYLN